MDYAKSIEIQAGDMIKPPIPSNEMERLESLRTLKILDTTPEERFDRITRLAQRAFSVPIALVSIVDANRQWFKSRQGLEATETTREVSFCGHAILNEDVMVVTDAADDERFHDNPLVTCDPNIRFYAGYPISAPDGNRIGTLCVIDRESREFSQEDIQLLQELGAMIEEELVEDCLLTTDPITGLSNLRGMEATVSYLLPLCERKGMSLSVQLFRLEKGSDALLDDNRATSFANILAETFRDSDVVARVADDTFAAVIVDAGSRASQSILKRLDSMLDEHNRNQFSSAELVLSFAQVFYRDDRHDSIMDLIDDAQWQLFEQDQGIRQA